MQCYEPFKTAIFQIMTAIGYYILLFSSLMKCIRFEFKPVHYQIRRYYV